MTQQKHSKEDVLKALEIIKDWAYDELRVKRDLNDYRHLYTYQQMETLFTTVECIGGAIVLGNLAVFGIMPKDVLKEIDGELDEFNKLYAKEVKHKTQD